MTFPACIQGWAARAWCGMCVLACAGLLFLFSVATQAADNTPPIISSFTVRQAVVTDFPLHIQFAWSNYHGACYDPSTGITVNRAIYLTWPVTSNWTYSVWFGPSLFGPWQEWGLSTNVHPARLNGIALTFVPVYPLSNRYYQIRANSSAGITYP